MSIPSARQNPETDHDDVTVLVPDIALVLESDEDEATAATDGGLLIKSHPALVAQTPPVPAAEALSPRTPTPEQPAPELEQVTLREDNVRLQRENTVTERDIISNILGPRQLHRICHELFNVGGITSKSALWSTITGRRDHPKL